MTRPGMHTPPSAPMNADEVESLAEFMAAFSAGSRLRLLFALVGVERTVEQLAEETELSATVVSQQLRVLRLLRLVTPRRDGRHMRYRLFDDHIADLLAAIRYHGEHADRHAVATPQASIPRAPRSGRVRTIR